MSEAIITQEIQDRLDQALNDLTDAIHAAKAMSHVVGLNDDDIRNDAITVVVRALDKAYSAPSMRLKGALALLRS